MGLVCCFFKSFRPGQLEQPSSGLVYPAEKGLRRGEATASGVGVGRNGRPSPSLFFCTSLLLFSAKSHPTLCSPADCSTPGFPVLHQLLESAQTHVH